MMDKEQQIRINFLDEAEDCFDTIESVLLNISTNVATASQLDLALRASHSVKGGSAMMGFVTLSNIAHQVEDFFKILRSRYHSTQIDLEIETLLLYTVDRLRQVSKFHRLGNDISEQWLQENVDSLFTNLKEHLGEVELEDEQQLLQNENENDDDNFVTLLLEGLDNILEEFESQWQQLNYSDLSEKLLLVAEQIMTLARIGDVSALILLCQSIQAQAKVVTQDNIDRLAEESLKLWQRSHALIIRGSFSKIPTQIEGFQVISLDEEDLSGNDNLELLDLVEQQMLLEHEASTMVNCDGDLQLNQQEEFEPDLEVVLDQLDEFEAIVDIADLADIQEILADDIPLNVTDINGVLSPEQSIDNSQIIEIKQDKLGDKSPANSPRKTAKTVKTIRVPVDQLYQFNSLFSKLILERNRVNLRLEQMKNFTGLMRQRMEQLEKSNLQLRNWYDRASLEGMLPTQPVPVASNFSSPSSAGVTPPAFTNDNSGNFDSLEMDQYTDLHLISQEQIETIVQLQEVTSDIELGLQEMNQAVQELNHTSGLLQNNVTRTQMSPFAELVKPFPRLIRDLSLQFNKKVKLKIEGESTLLDRAIIESLNSPLIHLIRNAFDHGIEPTDVRVANGKPAQGNITLNAINRGTETIITISDDGGGINIDKICDRLRQSGVSAEQVFKMSQEQVLGYIFQPSFSTKDEVTELSGRGVGMDVVRTAIEEIRGEIDVQTQPGMGTTFTIKVPYTLSILRVMLVESGGAIFAIPANMIRQIFKLDDSDIFQDEVGDYIRWQEQNLPLLDLQKTLIFQRSHKSWEMNQNPVINQTTALVMAGDNDTGAIKIDRFWGEQEVSVRPIESPIPLPAGFVSSMILGDGRVVPVVDPLQILEQNLHQESQDHSDNISSISINNIDRNSMWFEDSQTILVVDDSINVRRYLALTLEKAGYQVEQAKDGQEAIDKLMNGLSVQAVICDIEMPRVDGYGVLEEIKGKSKFQSLPIAMLTSRSNEKHRKLAFNLGADAYFSKPYNEQELLQTIADLITVQAA